MATAPSDQSELNIREQLARIDKMQAEISKIKVDTRAAPWALLATGIAAGGGLVAAGAALAKLFLG